MTLVTPGTVVWLRCGNPDCWVGEVQVIAKGGPPRHGPGCPHCRLRLQAEETWPEEES